MNEFLYSGLVASGFTLALFLTFVITYWAFRGFLPGSRVVEQPLVAPNDLDGQTATFRLFYVNWCPYSKDALVAVKQLEHTISGFTYGKKRILIEYTDCETHRDECALFKADAYPTYKLITSVKMYEYIGPANVRTYRTFLESALGKEEPV
jgi:hypothetical protein